MPAAASDSATPLHQLGHGIHAVDSGYVRPRFDAIHLIVEDGRAALVDTGTSRSVPAVLAALEALRLAPDAVDWVMLTHVHLDHAGGAGALMQAMPNARLTVHPRGARHMADPSRLWAGTVAVYGEAVAREAYGELRPVPAARIVETGEGATISLAGRRFDFIDTPGHARHHVAIRDAATGHLFTGDTFGISYRDFDVDGRAFIFPSSTPVQFDPDDTLRSVDRILALAPGAVCLTHWSRVTDVPRLGADLKRLTGEYVRIARAADAEVVQADASARRRSLAATIRPGLARLYLDALRAHGCTLDDAAIASLLAMDIELNAAGLVDWLERARVDAGR
ncbi:MAG: MBL fold metallo-hydrolase [Lautropia sp.]